MTWKMVGSVVASHFRKEEEESYVMLLVGLPVNRALLAVKSEIEIESILRRGQIKVGNGVLIVQRWSLGVTRIMPDQVVNNRWIHIWGLPLSEWHEETFEAFGKTCRGVDGGGSTISKS